jgi:hypothetical protein
MRLFHSRRDFPAAVLYVSGVRLFSGWIAGQVQARRTRSGSIPGIAQPIGSAPVPPRSPPSGPRNLFPALHADDFFVTQRRAFLRCPSAPSRDKTMGISCTASADHRCCRLAPLHKGKTETVPRSVYFQAPRVATPPVRSLDAAGRRSPRRRIQGRAPTGRWYCFSIRSAPWPASGADGETIRISISEPGI